MRQLPRFSIIHAVALLFAMQALLLAFFVTPPGDLPDESGHYAYVVDMTKGRPLPILGNAEIPSDLWKSYEGLPERHRSNYIVQHPPLYYAVAALPYALTKKFTENKEVLSRAPRVVSAISLGLMVLVLFHALRAAQVSHTSALIGSALIGFVPMISHLASGITNDIFLFLLCSLATLHLVRFVMGQRIIDAYFCALWLTLAGATKMTAWVFLAGCLGVLLFEMRRPLKTWIVHAGAVTALALALPVWWMRRNYLLFGDPFKVNLARHEPRAPEYSWMEYLQQQPFFESIFANFYGMFGFSGYCLSAETVEQLVAHCKGARMTRVDGASFMLFELVTMAGAIVFTVVALSLMWQHHKKPPENESREASSVQSWLRPRLLQWRLSSLKLVTGLIAGIALFVFLLFYSYRSEAPWSWTILASFGLLFAVSLAGLAHIFSEQSVSNRLIFYGPILLSLFLLLLYAKGIEAYRLIAAPAGLQGRYLYPFLPLLLVSLVLAFDRLKGTRWLLMPILVILAWGHANAYIDVALPFFNLVRI